MPSITVLAATAQVGDGVDAAHLEPSEHGGRERRRERHIEPAVAVEHRRRVAGLHEILAVGDEHRHTRTVLAGVEHLLRDIGRGITRDLRFAPGADRLRADVETQHAARGEVVGVGEESLGVLAVAAEAANGAENG